MEVTRRDFLKASLAVATALGLDATTAGRMRRAFALEAEDGGVAVVWLQAQSCSGCSVSLLNSIYSTTVDALLVNTLDLDFHSSLMAAAGNLSISAAEKTYRRGGYVLVVEGSIPTEADGKYCHLWPHLTAVEGVDRFAKRASQIIAVGTCACYGGIPAGSPNPTGAEGLLEEYYGKRVIKLPGCPTHPGWIVGTVAHLIANGAPPTLDDDGRPLEYFAETVHDQCPFHDEEKVTGLGQIGCLMDIGCKGPDSKGDCPIRRWNAGEPGESGVNWCIGGGSPCVGCTEPNFPDGMAPFYDL